MPRSLVWATDLDVLALDRVVERRDGYLVVKSPGNPEYYFGNLLLFDRPPEAGDGERWERRFAAEFAGEPRIRHTTFGWDGTDGALGAAREEFLARGYRLEEITGLVAEAAALRPHRRENREVEIRALSPDEGGDRELWDQVVELQLVSGDPAYEAAQHREFLRRRLGELQALFRAGRGSWYVALSGSTVVGSCGVVVTGGRGRFQRVDTALEHRRQGICSRLIVEASRRATRDHGAERFVIAADPGYHALGLYESLGFRQAERVAAVCRHPSSD